MEASMKAHLRLLLITAALSGAAYCFAQDAPAAAADIADAGFAKARAYGDKGTTELGLSGTYGKTALSGTQAGSSTDYSNIAGNFSIFAKYFLDKSVHVGGAFIGNISLTYDKYDVLTAGNGQMIVLGQAGYTFPLSPKLQLDFTGGIGGAAVFFTWTPVYAFTFTGQPMLLVPIGESANLGLGLMLIGINIDGNIMYDNGTSDRIDVFSFSTNAVLQLSVYF
jgi:hypothetical protein